MKCSARGFTVIELLVVISIIGMLSSVILASVSAARDKARIAAGITFERHTKSAFGDTIIAEYNFDNPDINALPGSCTFPAGSPIAAGLDLRTTSANPCTFSTTISPLGSGKSLEWDFPQNIYFSSGSLTPVPNFSKFTIGFWIKSPELSGLDEFIIQLQSYDDYDNGADATLQIDNYLGINFSANDFSWYVDQSYVISKSQVFDNRWHYVLVSVGSQAQVYLDGKLVATRNVVGTISPKSNVQFFAIRTGSASVYIDNLIFYANAI